jgi:hypothetical protein
MKEKLVSSLRVLPRPQPNVWNWLMCLVIFFAVLSFGKTIIHVNIGNVLKSPHVEQASNVHPPGFKGSRAVVDSRPFDEKQAPAIHSPELTGPRIAGISKASNSEQTPAIHSPEFTGPRIAGISKASNSEQTPAIHSPEIRQEQTSDTSLSNTSVSEPEPVRASELPFPIISNVCYDGATKKLVSTSELPRILSDTGRVTSISQTDFSSKKIVKKEGFWIYCFFCYMEWTNAHFAFIISRLVIAQRAAIDMGEKDIHLIMDNDTVTEKQKRRVALERKLLDYLAQDLKSISSFATTYNDIKAEEMVCFDKMAVPDYWQVIMRIQAKDMTYLRQLINRKAGTGKIYESCAEVGLHRPIVWILSRRAWSRKTTNDAELMNAVKRVFKNDVEVRVFDSPNLLCGRCAGYPVCDESMMSFSLGTNIEKLPRSSDIHAPVFLNPDYPFHTEQNVTCLPDINYDIALFNRITFLIAIHGAGLSNAMYMPRKSVVLEIMPYGVRDHSYQTMLPLIGLNHQQYWESNDTFVQEKVGRKMKPEELWTNEHRGTVKSVPVTVTIPDFIGYIERGRDIWNEHCRTKQGMAGTVGSL